MPPDPKGVGPGGRYSGCADAEYDALRLRIEAERLRHELFVARRAIAEFEADRDTVDRWCLGRGIRAARAAARTRRLDVVVSKAAGTVNPGVIRVPLAGMPQSGETRWADEIIVGGVALPGAFADPPHEVRYRIVPCPSLRFRAFVGIRRESQSGNLGGIRFLVSVYDRSRGRVAHAERMLDPRVVVEDRRWHVIDLDLGHFPPQEHELVLSTELPDGAENDYAWAVWGDPVLLSVPQGMQAEAAPSLARAVARRPWRTWTRGHAADLMPEHHTNTPPTVSILMPVHDPDPELLRRAIASVHAQTSPHWELCLSDDASEDPAVSSLLSTAAEDARVRLTRAEVAGGISAATNAAFALATGDFVAPLDHDDTLAPSTIEHIVARLAQEPTLDVLYTDNDKSLGDGARFAAALKPGWSPEFLEGCMYTLHLGVYRRLVVAALGGWRSAYDGAQDHDLVLRLADAGSQIGHLPEVLHHWCAHPGSAAFGELAKPDAYERGRLAVQDHLDRTNRRAAALALGSAGRFRVVSELEPACSVDLVVPVSADASADAVAAVLELLVDEHRPGVRLTAVQDKAASDLAPRLPNGVALVRASRATWGSLAIAGLEATSAPFVVLFEELAVPETTGWLDELIGLLGAPGLGAVGGLVLNEAGRVKHAGVALPRGVPLPVHLEEDLEREDLPVGLTVVTNRSAVSGVVAFRREALAASDGVLVDLERGALVAATLAAGDSGWRIAHSPHARFRVVGAPRADVVEVSELCAIARARGARSDPFYHPALWADRAAHVVPQTLQRAALIGD